MKEEAAWEDCKVTISNAVLKGETAEIRQALNWTIFNVPHNSHYDSFYTSTGNGLTGVTLLVYSSTTGFSQLLLSTLHPVPHGSNAIQLGMELRATGIMRYRTKQTQEYTECKKSILFNVSCICKGNVRILYLWSHKFNIFYYVQLIETSICYVLHLLLGAIFSNQRRKNNFKITLRICILNKHSKPSIIRLCGN